MQMSQSGQRSALNEFFQWESQAWVEAVADLSTDEKVYFMPLEKVKSYFTANDNCALSKILVELFKTDFPPIDPELLLRDHTAIFCILLRIGKGEFIEDFAQYEELSDRRLPFDPKRPPEEFTNITDDEAFLERFCEKQRMYCVPVFDGHMLHKNFGRQRLLPIISAEAHEKDGLVRKYVIEVYGPHNRLHASKGKDTAKTNTFVLKRYPKMAEIDYKQEVNGFRSVKQSESIIKFYGSFIQGDDYNILLEFADRGSLEQYFEKESPPSRGVDIIKFWEALFQLIKGLKAIHSVRPAHLNVNPENISVLSGGEVSSSDWQFKFSNFGLINGDSEFVQRDSHTYKAPEHDGSSSSTWAADIWSLGCIYSEAAMWIADGYKGIEEYRRQRMAESETTSFRGMDGFHDGSNVLQTVLDAHRDIEDRLRRSDYITKDVLDSMVEEMLWEEDRPNAKALARKADTILARARQKVSSISGDDSSRPPSSQSRPLPPPRLRPPTQPLPPIPRVLSPGLSSIAEQQQPPNVDKWRAQIQELQVPRSLFNNGPSSGSSSPTVPHQQLSSAESVSDFDRDLTGSVASWNFGDTNSTTSPSTPFSSPHVSAYYDYQGHNPNEGRPRAMPPQVSQEYRIPLPPRSTSRGHSYQIRQHSNSVDSAQAPSAPLLRFIQL
ncbi:hypothetical protein B0J14DRAFT_35422 [Halenospora varia]|nr:hypothetical protein B0J14DRAFT_35422 [Halenospora varia]